MTPIRGIDFVLPVGGDQLAMAYRKFDHWHKREHYCEHDSILDCIRMYGLCFPDRSEAR